MTFSSWRLRISVAVALFLSSVAALNMLDSLRREHSLIKPYQGAGMNVPQWDFTGSTMVTSNFIRLTPDQQSKQGAIWNSVPCYTTKWEFQVQFSVHGTGRDLYGDGFAIWYTKTRMQLGPVFGNQDLFSGLAVFLDTYNNHNGPHNHEHPFVSAMVNNGSAVYDHDRDGTHTQLAGCAAKFRGKSHPTHIAIRYEPSVLKVSLDIDGKNQWTECFRVEGVELPTGYYFGVSAATGDLSDNHDIVSLKFYNLEENVDPNFTLQRSHIIPSAKTSEAQREHVEDVPPSKIGKVATSGLKVFGYIILIIIVCIVLIFGGIFLYQYSKEDRRKRFY
ncbi:Vesicular integral-membrane protein VIP36 [Hypsibius exemplaris]|uniref:Vesicular integral-membrane protein VIP36 n=1 Tax=Hypsibius exemplaris TaxID=2072580 RepID=A0A1W0WKX2_HYPEX|nr:Vesicular integral-membrane protein VIP36 [Hypsibius exemplaris]